MSTLDDLFSSALAPIANETDPTKGAALVGYEGDNVKDALDQLNQKVTTGRVVTVVAATSNGQTLFPIPGGYPVNLSDVYVLGARLINGIDYSATDGLNVTVSASVASRIATGVNLVVESFGVFAVANAIAASTLGASGGAALVGYGAQTVKQALDAVNNGAATDAGAATSFTGAETLPVSRGSGLLQTTFSKIATFVSGVAKVYQQAGTGAVARTILAKLLDMPLSVTDFGAKADGTPYVTTGGTDNTAAINAAFLAASTLGFSSVVFPDAAGVYNVSGTLFLQQGVWVKGIGGRPKINLTAAVTNVVDTSVLTQLYNQGWDNVDILCNSLANVGIYLRNFKQFFHSNCQVEDFNQQGFVIGDPAASPNSDSYVFNNLQTWRAHSNVPVPSIGMWLRAAADALGHFGGFVGATVGMQVQSGGAFYDVHNWARASTGVMTTGFLVTGGACTFVNCQADTATQIGFDLTGTGFVLDACKIFNNNGTTATDNVMVGVKFRTVNPQSTVSNLASQGNDNTHRIATDIQTADGTLTGLSIVGSSNVNVVTPIGVANISTSLNVGDQTQTATNLTITAADNTNRQLIFGWTTYPMWIWRVSGQNTGSNQGSNMALFARTDTGGSLFQALSIARASNQWQISDTNTLVTTIHTVYGGGWALKTIGAGFRVAEGTNAKQGTIVLAGTTTVVANTAVTANSRIFLTGQQDGGTPGAVRVSSRVAGTSFTITSSSSTDASTVAYEIFEPA